MKSCNKLKTINKTFIVTPADLVSSGATSNCSNFETDKITSCSGGSVELASDLVPVTDDLITLGSKNKRFREVNTVSGSTSVFIVDNEIISPSLNLGNDSNGETRIINANNSVLQNDTLVGGTY